MIKMFWFMREWPLWLSSSVVLATTALMAAIVLSVRLWSRRRAHRKQVPARADATRTKAPSGIQILKQQWGEAIRFLKRSNLRKRGNALYVLPWYMVIGAPGAGKTTALRLARLTSFADMPQKEQSGSACPVEWSFFEQAVALDTAGYYCAPDRGEGRDEEWNCLLDLLYRSRRRQPLNGLTVVIAADALLNSSGSGLEAFGATLRQRIHQLMKMLGYRVPVYLLVTKCDLLPGMTSFCEQFSPQGLRQAMGYLENNSSPDAGEFLAKALSTIGARLKSLRLLLAAQTNPDRLDPAVLQFPESFGALRTGLEALFQGAFAENLYQDAPIVRGLFFAGSQVQGDAGSRDASAFFLHDLFAKILPADRGGQQPTRQALSWRRGTLSLGVLSWLAFSSALGGFMSYSFVKNLKVMAGLREAVQDYAGLEGQRQEFASKVLSMERLQDALVALEKRYRGPMPLNFGLWDVSGAGSALKSLLSGQFRLEILTPIDAQYRAAMDALTAGSSDDRFCRYVGHLVGRLSILREKLNGAERQSAHSVPLAFPFLRVGNHELDADLKERVAALYLTTVFWFDNKNALGQERTWLQAQLKRLLASKGRDPSWLIAWAAQQRSTPPVLLGEIWGGRAQSGEPSVPGLFSQNGKALLEAFFQEIDYALNEPVVAGELRFRFEQWYRQNAFDCWSRFLIAFPQGQDTLGSSEQWRGTANRITLDNGPYGDLRRQLLREFADVAESDLPAWLKHVRQIRDLEKKPSYWKYRQAVEKVAKVVSDPAQVVAVTAQAFDASAAPGSSVFALAYDALNRLKTEAPKELSNDAPVWALLAGPLDFLWAHARRETADRLQSDWEAKVLAQATGLDAAQGLPVLLSRDGPAMRFAKEQAAPFLEWRPAAGFRPKTVFRGSVPLTGAFFSFLNGAVWMSSVNNLQVGITATTPEVNAGAHRIPHVLRLTLHCSGKDQVLLHRRLRVLESTFDTVEKTFTWTPACGETTVEIDLAGNHLVKSYPGSYGFFAFLHDFQSGTHALTRHDFPENSQALADLNVSSIAVHYRLKGAPDFAAPKAAPARIISH